MLYAHAGAGKAARAEPLPYATAMAARCGHRALQARNSTRARATSLRAWPAIAPTAAGSCGWVAVAAPVGNGLDRSAY